MPKTTKLRAMLRRLDDRTIIALYGAAKRRGYAFFRDPHAMIALRQEKETRQKKDQANGRT